MTFGSGTSLRQFSKRLRDPQIRWKNILEVVRRDSVIEGLPDFTPQSKEDILQGLKVAV